MNTGQQLAEVETARAADWWTDKVAIVTGASRGIGRAIATQLADHGVRLVLNGRDPGNLDAVVDELAATVDAVGVRGSVTNTDTPHALVEAARERFGRVDLIVNNAATSAHYGALLDCDRDAFVKTMTANTWPTVELAKHAVALGMHDGAIVNISTTGAQRVHPVTGPYTASKAALDSITATLAHELGSRQITVNAVAPGLVRTDLARVLWEGERGSAERDLVPLGRLGEPGDIAGAATFLLGPTARWLTGMVIRVDGGRYHVGGEPADMIGRSS